METSPRGHFGTHVVLLEDEGLIGAHVGDKEPAIVDGDRQRPGAELLGATVERFRRGILNLSVSFVDHLKVT